MKAVLMAFAVGDKVVVTCHDEGYSGKTGVIVAVFPSGRCLVSVGPIVLLNVPPEGLKAVDRLNGFSDEVSD